MIHQLSNNIPHQDRELFLRQQAQHKILVDFVQLPERYLDQVGVLPHQLHDARPDSAQVSLDNAVSISPLPPTLAFSLVERFEHLLNALLTHLCELVGLNAQWLDDDGLVDVLDFFDGQALLLRKRYEVDILLEVASEGQVLVLRPALPERRLDAELLRIAQFDGRVGRDVDRTYSGAMAGIFCRAERGSCGTAALVAIVGVGLADLEVWSDGRRCEAGVVGDALCVDAVAGVAVCFWVASLAMAPV